MSDGYMGSTGDQFAGEDPQTVAELRDEVQRLRIESDRASFRERRQLELSERRRARVEQLEQALGEVRSAYDDDRQTWKQRAAQMMLFAEVALHPDQRETT